MQPKPSLLSGAIGLVSWARNPARAWKFEREQWRDYASYRDIRKLGLVECLERRPEEAIPPKYNDLSGLYRLVMKRRPKIILELGGGCSTFVLAAAAKAVGARLYSVDQSDHWQSLVRDAMPKHLAVSYHLSDIESCKANGVSACRYKSLPTDNPNMVYVDGGSAPGQPVWADAWALEKNAPPDFTILVDGRQSTCQFLRDHLKRRYKITTGLRGGQVLFIPLN